MSQQTLKDAVIAAIRTVYDPEIPVNLYDLGLIYQLDVSTEGAVDVRMTLTSPACPVAGTLPGQVEAKVRGVPGVTAAKVELVWDPPWTRERMSPAARLALGFDDDGGDGGHFADRPRPGQPFVPLDSLRRRKP